MFELLEKINKRPEPFQFYTAEDLWTDDHTFMAGIPFDPGSEEFAVIACKGRS